MNFKRALTVQDISCVGQCSLTVALPIISACGIETAVLPSAVLSTHTAGFTGYTFRDLTDDIPAIAAHWKREGLYFDCIYTGYLGSERQIDEVLSLFDGAMVPGGLAVVDPAMADNGRLYPAFDMAYVRAMRRLCAQADVLLPNITEACFLTDLPYRESYDEGYISQLCEGLHALGTPAVVLTGVGYEPGMTGVLVSDRRDPSHPSLSYYRHHRIARSTHGTGDVYASAFVGALLRPRADGSSRSLYEAARIAADFTVQSILCTTDAVEHAYGVRFEQALPRLIELLSEGDR